MLFKNSKTIKKLSYLQLSIDDEVVQTVQMVDIISMLNVVF